MEKKRMICNFFHSHHKPNPDTSIPCDPPLAVSDSDTNINEIEWIPDNPGEEVERVPDDEAPTELPRNIDNIGPEADNMSETTWQLEPPRSPEITDSLTVSPCRMALEESHAQTHHHPHSFVLAPSRALAEEAAKMISEIIWPHWKGGGHKHSIWDDLTWMRLV